MEVVRSQTIGYCYGVANTLKMAEKCIEKGKAEHIPYYCIGELIHNKDVVRSVEEKGLKIIHVPGDARPCCEGDETRGNVSRENDRKLALIRAHGIPEYLRRDFLLAGFELLDATCVNIKYSISEIKKASSAGRHVVIIGVKNHAETLCLMGSEGKEAYLVSSREDLDGLFSEKKEDTPLTVITQTTFLESEYNAISAELKKHYQNIVFANRLCPDCIHRKRNVLELASACNAIVVVGGRMSENTKTLAKYAEDAGAMVFRIENARDFTPDSDEEIRRYEKVGVCSGTSTPMDIIDEVCAHLEAL